MRKEEKLRDENAESAKVASSMALNKPNATFLYMGK
jgi:hypothetical protein